jgi:4-amino-4-deoxy-L-arabinose transferase-like glycosyltransferase
MAGDVAARESVQNQGGPALRPRGYVLGLAGVLALALVVFAVPAGRRPFWSSDEARFAVLAQDILEHARWAVPQIRGDFYLNKPQLYFWSIAVLSLAWGRVTELSSAIPSVVSATATVAAVAAIGRLLWAPQVGLLAALMLTATLPFYAFSHTVLSDVMMTAFMTWAMYFVLRAHTGRGGTPSLVAFYVCIGAAVLAKGPAGLAMLAAVIVATAVTRGLPGLSRLKPLIGLAVLAAAAVVWFAPYLLQSEGRFVSRVLTGHYATWYFGGGLGPRLVQVANLAVNFLPWTILLAAAAVWWPRHPDLGRRWLGAAALTLTIVVALSRNERARYLLPIYPGLALLVADFVVNAAAHGGRRALRIGAWTVAGLTAVAAIVGPFLVSRLEGDDSAYIPDSRIELVAISALVLAAAVVMAVAAQRGVFVTGTAGVAVLIAVTMVLVGATYPVRYTRSNDLRPLAEAAARHTPPSVAVVAHPDARLSLDFYVRRRVVEATTPEAVAALVSRAPGAVITTSDRWQALAAVLPAGSRVAASGRVGGRHFVVIVP